MQTDISRWGNSLAVRLPRAVVERLGLEAGTTVEIEVEDDRIVVARVGPRYELDALLEGITPDNIPDSTDDAPRGAELL